VVFVALGLFPQEWLRRLVERRLQAVFGPEATLGRIHVVPLLMRVELEDLRFGTAGFHLEVPRARARVAMETLIGRAYALRSLDVEGLRLDVHPASPRPVTTPGKAAATLDRPVRLDDLRVTGAVVVYHEPALGGTLRLEGIRLGSAVGRALEIEAAGGVWSRPRPLALGPVTGKLQVTPSLDAKVETLEFGTASSRLTLSGPLGRLTDLRPDLSLHGHVDLTDLTSLGAPPSVGTVTAGGHVRLGEAGVRVEGRDLRLAGGAVPHVTLTASHSHGVTDVKAQAGVFGGRVDGEARLVGSRATGQLRLAGLNVAAVREAAVPTAPAARGRLDGDLRWEGDIRSGLETKGSVVLDAGGADGAMLHARADATGRVRPADGRLDLTWKANVETPPLGVGEPAGLGPGRIVAEGTLRGRAPLEAEGRFEARADLRIEDRVEEVAAHGTLRAIGSRAVLAGEGQGFGGRAMVAAETSGEMFRSLRLRGEAFELAAVGSLARDLAGTVSFTFDGAGRLDRLDGTGRAALDGLTARGFAPGPIKVGVELRKGSASFTVEAPDLNADGDGRIDPRTRRVQGTLRLAKTPVARLTSAFAPERRVTGDVSGQVELRASLDRLAEPDLTLSDLRLEGEGLALGASGRLHLGRDATVDALGRLRVDLARLPVPEGWTLGGGLDAELRVQGPLRRPHAVGQAAAQGVALQGPRLPALSIDSARLRVADDALVLDETTVDAAGGAVRLSGRAPLAAVLPAARAQPDALTTSERADLRVTWQGLEAARLLRAVLPARELPVTATLAGEIHVTGGLARLGEVQARAVLPETAVQVEGMPLRLAPTTLHLGEGRLRLDPLVVTTGDSSVGIAGVIDLGGPLDLRATGRLDPRALSPLLAEASLTGVAEVGVIVGGTLRAPDVTGRLALRDATLRLRTLPQAITALQADLLFDRSRVRVENGSAGLGGGDVRFAGSAALVGLRLEDVRLDLTGRDIALRYPEGLRSLVDADLALTGGWASLKLAGTVRAKRGFYDRDIVLEEGLLAPPVEPTRSPLLRAIALDLRVETENPVRVRNNVAELLATADLGVRGDLETPAPFGRLEILTTGAKVFLYGQEFRVESGTVIYDGSWDPDVSLKATKAIENRADGTKYTVKVGVEGSLVRPQPKLVSEPPLPDAGILGLITTGSSGSALSVRSGAATAGGQVAMLMAGRVTRGVSRQLRELGLGEVSIQPELVARDTDPSARFTFGIPLAPRLDLIYSLGLAGPEDRFLKVEGRPGPLVLFAQRSEDDVVSVGAGQRFAWGGPPEATARAEEKVVVSEVRFEGADPSILSRLRDRARTRPGRRVDVWDLQEDADRLRERLRSDGYLDAEVGARLSETSAVFQVRSGARYTWRVSGMRTPPDLTDVVRQALHEEEAIEKGRARLLRELHERGHLRANVTGEAIPEGDTRVLAFNVEPGLPLDAEELVFPGASVLSPGRLRREAGGAAGLLTDPDAALTRIREAYQRVHHRAAEAGPARIVESEDGRRVRITVPVREGPRARVAALRFEGGSTPESEMAAVASLGAGDPFDEARVQSAVDRVREHYFGLGYPAVRVSPRLVPAGEDLDVVLRVTEGERVVVGAIELAGARRTPESVIRRRVALKPGDPLDPRKLAAIERRVLELGLFSRVSATATADSPATVRVMVVERPQVSANYDVRYSDAERITATAEGDLRHLFGLGLGLGGRHRAGADLQDTRASLHLPLGIVPGTLTATAFRTDEDLLSDPSNPESPKNRRLTRGFQVHNTLELPDRWRLEYGYSFKRATVQSPLREFPLDITEDVASLDSSLVRDSRDDVLDPRRGRLLSLNLELSPAALGSSFTFAKGFAQALVTRPLTPSLTWAHGYRLGLAHAFGRQFLQSSERFRAGGGNSVRGFATDALGPRDARGRATFGDAVLIVNQELRYRHPSGVGGAVFYDAGNVFEAAKDLSLRLRHSVGAGVRWQSPVGLLRLDVGFPLDRRAREPAYQYFISLGQAF
jgi:outer membrane protein insertion porin family